MLSCPMTAYPIQHCNTFLSECLFSSLMLPRLFDGVVSTQEWCGNCGFFITWQIAYVFTGKTSNNPLRFCMYVCLSGSRDLTAKSLDTVYRNVTSPGLELVSVPLIIWVNSWTAFLAWSEFQLDHFKVCT